MAPRKPLSPVTLDRVERLARSQVKPILAPPKAQPPIDPNNPLAEFMGSPARNVPGDKPFTGPTLDPDVMRARAELTAQSAIAIAEGIDPARVKSIEAGKQDPNRGFLGPAKFIGGKLKGGLSTLVPDVIPGTRIDISDTLKPVGTVAGKAGMVVLSAAAPTLDKFDIGRRFIVSAVAEVARDKSNASFKDFIEQGFAGTFGIGTKEQAIGYGDLINTGNAYADQLLGFTGDVLLDPITWFTGVGGIAKSAGTRATLQGGKAATRYAAAEADRLAAALARKIAEEAAEGAARVGDNLAAEAARRAIRAADIKAAKAAKALSGDAASRQIGRTSNQALASSVLGVKDDAQRFLNQAEDLFGAPPRGVNVTAVAKEIDDELAALSQLGDEAGPIAGGLVDKIRGAGLNEDTFISQYADALRTTEVLTPAVIKNIQTSGLAGIAGPYLDILRGTRTAAQDVLGVRGGLRIYNPLNLAVGPRNIPIPGKGRILNVTGKLIADSRLGVGRTAVGINLLNKIVPTGEGGILGSEDLLRLRADLRSGSLKGVEAEEATRLVDLDNRYRAAVQNERKVAAGKVTQSGIGEIDDEVLDSVLPYLQSDPSTWAGRLPALDTAQQAAYDAVKNQLEDFYVYAARASGATGFVPPKRPNYFPQMQSQDALRWAERNPKKAEELAKKLNVDRTWFLGNFRARELEAGDIWFGVTLTDDDIGQGVIRLNQIAKDSGAIKFDFFETSVKEALNKYANKHAQFSALQKTLGSTPEQIPGLAFRTSGGMRPTTVQGVAKPQFIGVGEEAFEDLLNPANLQLASPDQLQDALNVTKQLVNDLNKPLVIKERVVKDIDELNARLEDIAASAALAPPGVTAVATDEVKKLARLLYEEVLGARVDFYGVPAKRFADYVGVVDSGFFELNQFTTPDIAARADIAELFQNAQRMGDEQFARRVKQLNQDYVRFSKAYLVMRPGFHVRNAISNAFQFVAAGGTPANGRQGVRLQAAINEGLKQGKTVREVATALVKDGKKYGLDATNPAQRFELIESLTEAINFSGATGFGQFGELAKELGVGRRGFTQTKAPRNKFDSAVGSLVSGNRKVGTAIENVFRFGLMWDGIKKGLTPQESAARVNKYLIDYSDYSKADKVARQVIPFWTFMSRNAPLQMELMFTNPKAYATYNSLKRNLEDQRTEEEGGLIIPFYERDRGVFATKEEGFGRLLPGTVIRPGLPFEGGGENVLSTLIQDPKKLIASVSPLFRAPVEALITNKKFFSEGAVVPKEFQDAPTGKKLEYLARELASPVSPLRSIVAFIPNERRPEFLNDLIGLKVDDEQANIQELQSLLNWAGVPLGNIRTEQQKRELESRLYEIGDLIDAKRRKDKIELEKGTKTPGTGTIDPSNPLAEFMGP